MQILVHVFTSTILYSCINNRVFTSPARAAFENGSVAVAIGPQIDVFTSTDYVILNQIHFVTTSDAVTEAASRTMPILPDPKSLSIAIAKVAKDFGWNKVAFLSQGMWRLRVGSRFSFNWGSKLK